jgi:hypothetical protein
MKRELDSFQHKHYIISSLWTNSIQKKSNEFDKLKLIEMKRWEGKSQMNLLLLQIKS